MLAGIKAFFEDANAYLEGTSSREETLGDYVNRTNPNPGVIENLILPMASAIWSTSPDHMLKMPAHTLFTFLKNHGMLGIGTQFQWLTLVNGSQQYRDIVKREIEPCIKLSNGAVSVLRRPNGGATVIDERGERRDFDAVVIATHADQAYNLLERPTLLEAKALRKFKYNANTAVLHSDPSVMPKARRAWASWNYRYDDHAGRRSGSTHYWMNSLQGVSDKRDYFVSVDYGGDIDPSKIHWSTTYEHPRYDADAIRAQKDFPSLNFDGSIYYCGSYFRYGFHEDAYTSALHVCKMIAAKYGQGAAA